MKCLNCSRELNNLVNRFGCIEYECRCGVMYSPELVREYETDETEKKEWNRIRRWRLFGIKKTSTRKILTMYCINKKIVHPLHYKIHQLLIRKGWIKDELFKPSSGSNKKFLAAGEHQRT